MTIALFGGWKVGVQIKIATHNVFITMTNEAFIVEQLGDTFGQLIKIIGHWCIISTLQEKLKTFVDVGEGNYLCIVSLKKDVLSPNMTIYIFKEDYHSLLLPLSPPSVVTLLSSPSFSQSLYSAVCTVCTVRCVQCVQCGLYTGGEGEQLGVCCQF